MGNPDKPITRPTVPEVLPLARVVYARHCAGCCAHVILDDYNAEQIWADLSLETAQKRQHADCIALCAALAQMTATQRLQVAKRKWREE